MRAARIAFAACVAAAAGCAGVLAGGNLEEITNNGSRISDIFWDSRALPIVWRINSQGVVNNCNNGNPFCTGGVSPVTLQNSIDVLDAGYEAWEAIPTSRIAYTFGGTSTRTTVGLDDVHLVTWADTNPNLCPTGVVATTPSVRVIAPLTVSSTNRDLNGDGIVDLDPAIYPTGTVIPAGTIIDADIAWCAAGNDFIAEPLDANPTTFDIGAVGTHEIGHFHGLSHSTLIAPIATMLPFVDFTEAYARDIRVLSRDDEAAASRYYPEPSFASDYGRITGRLFFPGGTTAADGVSVTAIDRATGEQVVQVFSVSRFTSSAELPGSFRIDGLPPGEYLVAIEYFDGAGTAGFDAWWDNNRFNLTIVNGNVTGSGVNPPRLARPEFLSAGDSGSDDLAESTRVAVAAGGSVNVGSIVINLDAPPAPAGSTALNMKNGTIVQVAFPSGFTFPFFGQSYSSVFVGDNGNVTFGVAGSTLADTRNFLGPDITSGGPVPPRIGFPMTNMDPGGDNQGQSGGPLDVFRRFVSDAAGDRFEIIFQGIPVIETRKSNTVILRLYRSGRIEIQNRFVSAWYGIVGVSPGGDGTAPAIALDLSSQLPYSGSAGQAIFEHFEFAQGPEVGGEFLLQHANDTNGALLVFAPNAAGGYDVSSPDFRPGRPGEVLNLRFTDATTLAWDPRPEAAAYNLYRGTLGAFTDSDLDGAADAYGSCLSSGLGSPGATDTALPGSGGGYFYLATGRNVSGEGPLGAAGSGALRPNPSPCP
jgi:hypothetical protein